MRQIFQNYKTGELSIDDVPPPSLSGGGILVRNIASLISAGTERTTVTTAQKSLVGKAQMRPDLVKKVLTVAKREGLLSTFRMVQNKLDTIVPLGYSSAGEVIAVAADVDEFSVGDRVACAGQGYASHAEIVFVPRNLAAKIPHTVSIGDAAYTTLGAIALQGVRQSGTVIGNAVAVIGLGLIGLLTVQILKAAGCRVMGFDVNEAALEVGLTVGCDKVGLSSALNDATIDHLTAGYGFDCSILTASTKDNSPILMAGDITRNKGRMVIVGAVPANIPRSPFYEKEIEVSFSRSYGPGRYDTTYEERGLDYPHAYVRWTENRNMLAFIDLLEQKKIDLRSLTTHRFTLEEAKNAYDIVSGKKIPDSRPIGMLIEYDSASDPPTSSLIVNETPAVTGDQLKIGFIGAGSFAQNYLLPPLKRNKRVRLVSVATARGLSSTDVAKKFKFESATTDSGEIINNPDIDAVFITTRHDQHADLATRALKQHKSVYLEKPLALDWNQLDALVDAYAADPGRLMIGFNRRFAPSIYGMKKFLAKKLQPCNALYRINAGYVPKDHWTQDPIQGGGRILGEVCHFVDLLAYLIDSVPVRLYAEVISTRQTDVTTHDNLSVTTKYRDGSVSTILYTASGDRSFPKERLEIFSEQTVATVDDFRYWTCTRSGKTKKFGSRKQDKGYKNSLNAFTDSCKRGLPSPVPFEDAVIATISTFKILESLTTGQAVNFDIDHKQNALDNLSSLYSSILANRYKNPENAG